MSGTEVTARSMEEDLKKTTFEAGELAVKQRDDNQASLFQAKDRGQLTATTAMLVADIALLKEVIDHGSMMYRFYEVTFALVLLSIIMQIIVGVMAMLISNVTSYYEKFNEDPLQNIFVNMFHCKCEKPQKDSKQVTLEGAPSSSLLSCCCRCSTRVYEEYEYDILERYEKSVIELIEADLTTVKSKEQLSYLLTAIEKEKNRKQELEMVRGDQNAQPELIDDELDKVLQKMAMLQEAKRGHEEIVREANIKRVKGRVLYKYVDAIKKNHMLKRISFWQHCINYILYFIVLINAFVTGFGVAGAGHHDTPIVSNTTAH